MNGSLTSLFSSALSNEFRFQWAREDRPRPYEGPINPATGRPFPDTDIDFAGQYRIGHAVLHPAADGYDYRFQVLDNVSLVRRATTSSSWAPSGTGPASNQTFLGFANGRMAFGSVNGFLNYVANGNGYVECVRTSPTRRRQPDDRRLPRRRAHHRPGGPLPPAGRRAALTVEEAGTQTIIQHELALFLQDSWKPQSEADPELRPPLGGADRARA